MTFKDFAQHNFQKEIMFPPPENVIKIVMSP